MKRFALGTIDAAGIVARFQRADVDRDMRPRRAGHAAHQRRRARAAFGEEHITRPQQWRQRKRVTARRRVPARLCEIARERRQVRDACGTISAPRVQRCARA